MRHLASHHRSGWDYVRPKGFKRLKTQGKFSPLFDLTANGTGIEVHIERN